MGGTGSSSNSPGGTPRPVLFSDIVASQSQKDTPSPLPSSSSGNSTSSSSIAGAGQMHQQQGNPTVAGAGQMHQQKGNPTNDRKFNLVIQGIKECPHNTPRRDRILMDEEAVVNVLKCISSSLNEWSIRECVRLGRYSQHNAQSRLLLVRFNKVSDVLEVLSKRQSLPVNIFVKPDLSPSDRQVESILLKERRSLINASVNRLRIKIHNNCIYVDRCLFGRVLNGTFTTNLTLADLAPGQQ